MIIFRIRLIALLLMISSLFNYNLKAQPALEPELIAIGGGYDHLDIGFLARVFNRTSAPVVRILVLPIAYASNPETITYEERQTNVADAEKRSVLIQEICDRTKPAGKTCEVGLLPIFTRADAVSVNISTAFPLDLSGIFILGGDQSVAMQVLMNTPLESALNAAYERGVLVGGTSAGAAVQSQIMIAGFSEGSSIGRLSFTYGSIELWAPPQSRGLAFGIPTAVIDQHFFQQGRFPRLLNAISSPGVPQIGLGLDAYTGASIRNHRFVEKIFGRTVITVLDGRTYHASDSVQYHGDRGQISLRNVLLHLLPPGDFEYDLNNTRPNSRPAPPRIEREFHHLELPHGAGPIFIGGGTRSSIEKPAVINQFVNAAGGKNARILIVASGYASIAEAQSDAARYTSALAGAPSRTVIIRSDMPPLIQVPPNTTGVILIGRDQSLIQPDLFTPVRQAWLSGMPVLADDAGAAVIGRYYGVMGQTPSDETEAESYTQDTLIQSKLTISPGLNFFDVMFEPGLIDNNRWGRLLSLAFNHRAYPAIGISEGTFIVITPNAAQVAGQGAVVTIDFSLASLSLGENNAFAVINGLLDVFAPGELLGFTSADSSAEPIRVATPVISTSPPNPSPSPDEISIITPTPFPIIEGFLQPTEREPRATPTQEIIAIEEKYEEPQPTDIRLLHIMIFLAVVMSIAILIGIWVNRGQMNLR